MFGVELICSVHAADPVLALSELPPPSERGAAKIECDFPEVEIVPAEWFLAVTTARGFVIATAGVIDVSTVSAHRRAAIVNWLHPRRPVHWAASEGTIERTWHEMRTAEDEVIEVEIIQLVQHE